MPPFANVHGALSSCFLGVFAENRKRSPSSKGRENAARRKANNGKRSAIPQLRTPGVIATELGALLSRALYVLQKHSQEIKPIGRAGVLRLYDRVAVEMVRNALRDMDQRQGVIR